MIRKLLNQQLEEILSTNGGNITAINMIINPINCDEPCNSTITVTWKNIGNKPEKFSPTISINGNLISLAEMTLPKNVTTTKVFNLTNLIEGTYLVCPVPN